MVRWLLSGSALRTLIAPILGASIALSTAPCVASADCPDPPVIIQQPRSWVRGWDQSVTFSFQLLSPSSPPLQSGDFTWLKDGSPISFGNPAEDTSLAFVGVPPASIDRTASLTIFPNPFRGSSHVLLVVPKTGQVDVSVFDVAGRRVRQLHHGLLAAGRHDLSWDGTDDSGRRRPAGLYFVRARGVTSGSLTMKFVQMR